MFHALGAPWWLAIVFLTILVRGVLFPLTVRQVRSMRAMQDLRPEMEEIRIRYKDDRQKQQEALMALYREKKINPAAGFLPLLVQMPVFIAMYQVIRVHEETFRSFASGGLLWFTDLTKADPYFILPVMSAAILLGASEISSKNVNPNQRMMMRFLPVMFTFFIARFPAGLFVYWITSNTFTLLQNYLIYHRGPGRVPPASPGTSSDGPDEVPSETDTNRAAAKSAKRKARKRKRKRRR